MSNLRNIAILCSGGDCAGMNPAIKQFTEYSLSKGLQPFGVSMGFAGLHQGSLQALNYDDVSGIVHRGGTILGSSRFPEFHAAEVRAEVANTLKSFDIDALVVLGGNGSFRGIDLLHREHGVSVVGIPSTIDNDVVGSEMALGVDTSLNVIRHCLDQIRDTASSFHRAFVVETMGRKCGYLALVTALTSGAEICLVPEVDYDLASIEARLLPQIQSGDRTYVTAIVSEGVAGGAELLKNMIQDRLGMTSRITVLGHIQRGGSPTVQDRLFAFETVSVAIDELLEGQRNFMVGFRGGNWIPISLDKVESKIVSIPDSLLAMARRLSI